MKKKVLSCLLALSMSAALLAGCGSSSSDSKSSDDSKKTEEKADTTKALSATDYNFEPDYYFNTFNTNSLKDKPRQGIKTFKSAIEQFSKRHYGHDIPQKRYGEIKDMTLDSPQKGSSYAKAKRTIDRWTNYFAKNG